MEFLKAHPLTPRRVLIIASVVLGALIILSLAQNMLTEFGRGGVSFDSREESMSIGAPGALPYHGDDADYGYNLSVRNALPIMPPVDGGYASGDSEAYEVKNYSARIETDDLAGDCATVAALKSRTAVVFENTNTYERGCSFTFKVEKSSVDSVLDVLRSLEPKELNEHVYTIKREVDDYTSEIDILTKKLASLDQAYTEALAAYTSISDMATRNGDVENLAKIIESKLTLIERLTQARLQAAADLERMERAKAESLDRLVYTHFTVSIEERVYVDGDAIRDSWKYAVETAFRDANRLVQDATVGLIIFVITVMKFMLYAAIVLFVVRFGWGVVRKTWGDMTPKQER
jgi:hypothetical protein